VALARGGANQSAEKGSSSTRLAVSARAATRRAPPRIAAMSSSDAPASAAPPPERFDALSQTTALSRGADAANEFSDVDNASRQALWKQLLSVIGMDVMNMRLSLPVWVFEPSTALTRMAEMFEYSSLLDRAAKEADPMVRDALVAAFLVSAFAHTERVRKPFNPVLGETFAYRSEENGLRFLAEQVSHHPPISASLCEGRGWAAGEAVDIKATYLGNSIEISNSGPQAQRFITLTESGDRYSWNLPTAVVTNLFIGRTFVDHYGTVELLNETTETVSKLTLTKCGWFSAGRYQVAGELLSADGNQVATYKGEWNKFLDFERVEKSLGEGAMRLWAAGKHLLSDADGGGPTGGLPKFTRFGGALLALDDETRKSLPPTDSRLRPDRLALQERDSVIASEEKNRIEQTQRDRNAKLEEAGTPHVPRWFTCSGEGKNAKWERSGDYWAYAAALSDEERLQDALW
jgi:Oxysterol-binding protein